MTYVENDLNTVYTKGMFALDREGSAAFDEKVLQEVINPLWLELSPLTVYSLAGTIRWGEERLTLSNHQYSTQIPGCSRSVFIAQIEQRTSNLARIGVLFSPSDACRVGF